MRYILGIFGAFILIILAIVLIFRIGGNNEQRPGEPQTVLTEYVNSDAVARLTIDGKIVAQEKHYAVRVTVGRTNRTIEILNGYEGEVVQSRQYENDIGAYNVFLHAIQNAGFANKKETSTEEDVTGVCPLGNRYIYELVENGDKKVDLWSTSCTRKDGNFAGNASLVRQLFQAQIPDYQEITRDIRL
jgi:hypothetical protein